MEHEVPFLIVGGGIGGLTAALAIARTERAVYVLEKAPVFSEIGAGLQLAPNAMAVFENLGLSPAIGEFAVFPRRLVLMDAYTGNELSTLDLGPAFRKRYHHPYVVMHRADLLDLLVKSCQDTPTITLFTQKTVTAVRRLAHGVRVECADGTIYHADHVIGADGLWSTVRRHFSADRAVGAGYVAYRGTIPIAEIEAYARMDDVVMWIAPDLHFVQYPVRRRELYNQVAVFRSARYRPDETDWGSSEELDEHFARCCDPVRHAVSYIHRRQRWPMYDREPLDRWTDGRIVLLGDAAHPMLQYIAQGACQAIEDAGVLAEELALSGNDTARALDRYQKRRVPRATQVQQAARTFGQIIHSADPLTILLRNALLRRRGADDFWAVDWLYGGSKNL